MEKVIIRQQARADAAIIEQVLKESFRFHLFVKAKNERMTIQGMMLSSLAKMAGNKETCKRIKDFRSKRK